MLEALEPRGTREGVKGPALPAQFKRLLDRKARSRDLQNLGRNATWRTRPAKGRPSPETPSTVAAS
jgi:hypothetical protein